MAKALYATGRRKEAIARVRMLPGTGALLVNGRSLRDYLHRESLVRLVMQPFEVAQAATTFDVVARVRGGGSSGQAGALRLGVARCLLKHDPELRKPLRKIGLLTRDPRMKERKKYGLRGARRAFQFSKR
jgi:small subunit ribosomal protein S9